MKLFLFLKHLCLLGSIQRAFSQSSLNCPLYTWQCRNGQCIKSDELCDGNYDCADGSDETVEECLLRPCPSFAFQCAYGACITGNFKCNGITNCVDGSDENRYLCQPELNYERELQGNCSLPYSMQCGSGECISNDSVCNGYTDCRDGSDERVEICSYLMCPEYSFRCGYGACIPGVYACNHVEDCRDGSDEISNICSNITSTTTTTRRPSPQTTSTTTKTPHSSSTNATPSIQEKYCSSMTLTRGISSVASCVYQGVPISCKQDVKVGTTANVSCAPGYSQKHGKRNFSTMRCDSDGEWTRPKLKCIPNCGTLTEEQKDQISKPWEVTILRKDYYAPIFMPICSGVIVSPKIVLTVANCFLSYNNPEHIYYNLIEGFYNQSFMYGDYVNAKVHNISSIIIKKNHRTQDLAVLVLVNYFEFSHNLIPICLPTAQSNLFPFFDETQLNIGRPIIRDTNHIFLEYLIATIENISNSRKTLTYVNIYHYIPFINREIKKYDYIL